MLSSGLALWMACACAGLAADDADAGRRMIENYLRQEAVELDARFLDGVKTRDDWEKLRPKLREQYLDMLGLWPLPEKTPLEPHVTGVIERDEGFRVEKVQFQSRPHLYVTGNLYRPKQLAEGEKLPAVLYVCGHSGRGRDGNKTAFQHHGMWFATHGYVCLIIDTLQLGEIAGIHHGTYNQGRWWWQARGYTPAGVECWNGIRAIDYLQSRSEVDGDRIAVTGISGGGAASFWIAAADERVRVAVPVSGMSDLEDYLGDKVVNGHCDCMFLINTYRWPWTQIAALIAPRPLLFENSGHDPIFPMTGNDRIRARLERLYRLYADKPAELFDIGVTPGGHNDNPELRLMAYRWINRHLKGDNAPVTEPKLDAIEGSSLRAFPDDLPADEINTQIDESFVARGEVRLPQGVRRYADWRAELIDRLRQQSFRTVTAALLQADDLELKFPGKGPRRGDLITERLPAPAGSQGPPGIRCLWNYFPGRSEQDTNIDWVIVLGPEESFDAKPAWAAKLIGDESALVFAPRGVGPLEWEDKPPFYVQRSLPLIGETLDGGRVADVWVMVQKASRFSPQGGVKLAGRGEAGVIAAYAALLAPERSVRQIAVVDPSASHREGPIFLNVLRVLDIPDALGLLAPRPLRLSSGTPEAFERTREIYRAAAAEAKLETK